jgi:hypothetical protein
MKNKLIQIFPKQWKSRNDSKNHRSQVIMKGHVVHTAIFETKDQINSFELFLRKNLFKYTRVLDTSPKQICVRFYFPVPITLSEFNTLIAAWKSYDPYGHRLIVEEILGE